MKLEYGKRYLTRDGRVTGPLIENQESNFYIFVCPKTLDSFTEDGVFDLHADEGTDSDLVAEY